MPTELNTCEWLKVAFVVPDRRGIDDVEVTCEKGRKVNEWCRKGPRLDCDYYRRAIGLTLEEVRAKYLNEGVPE